MRNTGHEKQFQTLALSINLEGTKNKPCIVFKGKGKGPESTELKNRKDIIVLFSDNGWMNTNLTSVWLEDIFPENYHEKKLLIWDSFKCHVEGDVVMDILDKKNIKSAVIPGGCTRPIQTLDVCINNPFKSRMEDLFDDSHTMVGISGLPRRHKSITWLYLPGTKFLKRWLGKASIYAARLWTLT